MMKRFWSKLALQLGKRAGLVSAIGLLVTVLLGLGLPQLKFATGQDSYLNKDDQIAKDNVAYQKLFGGQIMITLFTLDEGTELTDLVTGENAKKITAVAEELRKDPNVKSVVTPLDSLQFSHNLLTRSWDDPSKEATTFDPLSGIANTILGDAAERDKTPAGEKIRADESGLTVERVAPFLTAGKVPSLEDPKWVEMLLFDNHGEIRRSLQSFFPDKGHAQMIVRLVGNADVEEEGAGAVAVKKAWSDVELKGSDKLITGAPVLLKDINDYLKGGILQLGGLAIAIMAVVLLVFFDVRWRLLPLAVVVVGVIWAFGLAGYLGIPLSVVTIAGLPVMLGVGIDFAIQMHARVEEEVVIDRAEHPIQETARNLGPALLVVTLDAVFAFAALRFAKVPMIRDFAMLLCIGVAAICLCSIVGTLSALGIREYKSPTKRADFREGALGRLVVWLGALPSKLALPMILLSIVIFAGGMAVEGKLTLQTDPVQWVNQKTQNRKDVQKLEDEVDSSSEMGVYVTAESKEDLFSDKTMAYLNTFTEDTLNDYSGQLLRASSILTPVSYLTDFDSQTPECKTKRVELTEELKKSSDKAPALAKAYRKDCMAATIAPTGEQIQKVYEAAPEPIQQFTVSKDEKALNILFTTRPGPLSDKASMVHNVREGAKPPAHVRVTPSGLAVVGVGLLENLESNRVQLTYLSIAFVFVFLTVRLRSVVRSLLSLVPVLIAVGAASLVAFALNLKLSPMTAVGGPLVIAVCTEFTSLILLRFIEERERGLSPQASADVTAARTGRAFIVSAMTAVIGVGVIATSSLPLLRDFGMIVAMNVVVALLAALVILPPIMVWAEERGWVTKGLVDPSKLGNKTQDEITPHSEHDIHFEDDNPNGTQPTGA